MSEEKNPWKQMDKVAGANPPPASKLKDKFEDMGKPAEKPKIIKGKTTWSQNQNSGGLSNQGKFDKVKTKPKKSDFGEAPNISDLP